MSGEPSARWGHSAVTVREKMYVWGGCTADMPRDCSNDYKTQLLSKVFEFDIQSSQWKAHQTTGVPPKAVCGAAACTRDDHNRIFTFGGYCGHGYHWYNELHELKLLQDHIQWRLIESVNNDVEPTTKQDCGIVYFGSDDDDMNVCVFGGAGNKRGKPNKWAVFDELHVFNLVTSTWHVPDVSGSCPPPCSGFSFDTIGIRQALLFGGKTNKDTVLNDVFLLSLDKWMWQKIPMTLGIELPMPRESHCSICIDNHLIVIGGINSKKEIVPDSWVLHTRDHTWKKINIPDEMTKRVSPIVVAEKCNENYQIIIFGGLVNWITGTFHSEQPMISKTIVLSLDVSEDVMLSYWYDLTPLGIQIKQLSKDLIETREILGTTRAKLDKLESTLSRHTVSSQGSIELEIDSYQDEDEQHTSSLFKQQSEPGWRRDMAKAITWINAVDDTDLDTDHASDVLEAIGDISEWKPFGLALGLHISTLNKISAQYKDVQSCKYEVVSAWLMRKDMVIKKCPPSWRSLVTAVNGNLVMYPHLAKKIAMSHPLSPVLQRAISTP